MAKTNPNKSLGRDVDVVDISDSVNRAFTSIVRYLPLALWLLVILSAWLNGILSKGIWVWLIVLLFATVFDGLVRVEGPNANNQILILSLLGGTPLFLPQSQTVDWLPLPMLVTVICLITVFSKNTKIVFALTVTLAVIEILLIRADFPGYLFGGAAYYDGFFAVIFLMANVLLFSAFAHFTRSEAATLDVQIRNSYQSQSSALLQTYDLAIKEKAMRKIHESVLNTLRALANPRIKLKSSEVLPVVKADLETILNLENSNSQKQVSTVILNSLANVDLHGIEVKQNIEEDFRVEGEIIDALSDALTEVFRNVERHSAASRLEISTRKVRNLTYLILEDNGIGFQKNSKTNFGLQVINNNTLRSNGRQVLVQSNPNSGTKITFTFDSIYSKHLDAAHEFLPLNSPRFRNLFLVLPSVALIFLPVLVAQIENQFQASIAFIAYWFVLLILVNIKLSKFRNLFAIISFGLAMASMATFGSSIDGCQQAQSFQWVGSAFSTMLLYLAVSPILNALKVIFAFVYFSNALLISIINFSDCQDLAVVPGLVNGLGALILSFGYFKILRLTTQNVQQQIELEIQAENSLLERGLIQSNLDKFKNILQPARTFFENLNSENFQERNPALTARAARIESNLRNSLKVLVALPESMQAILFESIEFCTSRDINLKIEIHSENARKYLWAPQVILEVRDLVMLEKYKFLEFNFFEEESYCQLQIIGLDENRNKETEVKLKSLRLNHVFQ